MKNKTEDAARKFKKWVADDEILFNAIELLKALGFENVEGVLQACRKELSQKAEPYQTAAYKAFEASLRKR